jgi:hypothetical protein
MQYILITYKNKKIEVLNQMATTSPRLCAGYSSLKRRGGLASGVDGVAMNTFDTASSKN